MKAFIGRFTREGSTFLELELLLLLLFDELLLLLLLLEFVFVEPLGVVEPVDISEPE